MREQLRQLRTRGRRWRLLRAYSSVYSARRRKSGGSMNLMAAYERAERYGVLSLDDGDVVWYWPEDGESA